MSSEAARRGRDMFLEDLTGHISELIPGVAVDWLTPDPKAGCVRFGLSDGRNGKVEPGDVGGWKNATIIVGAA